MHTICSALKIYKQQNKKIKVILNYIIQGLPGLEESLSLGKEKKGICTFICMYVCMSIIYMNSQKVKVIQVVHGQRAGQTECDTNLQ